MQTKELLIEELNIVTQKEKNLIVYNDDVNTFEFVIETLIKVCHHDLIQAEQCTHIIHYNGKCAVKAGSYKKLESLCVKLLNLGLTAQIE